MEDLLIRVALGALGVLLIAIGIAMFAIRGVKRTISSMFAPRVIVVQQSAPGEPGFLEGMKRFVYTVIFLAALYALLRPSLH